jgi:hypothetical protein
MMPNVATDNMLCILINKMLSEGPDVSSIGSPTVLTIVVAP